MTFHLAHLSQFLMHGTGLMMMEATAVTPEGRITPRCLGIWSDRHGNVLGDLLRNVRGICGQDARIGIQLAHAGRKGSTYPPFLAGGHAQSVPIGESVHPVDTGCQQEGFEGYETVAPSALAHGKLRVPRELEREEIEQIVEAFGEAARRADEAGFDVIEIHAAHGYLLHQFLSPLSNKRTDEYGGSFENRCRAVIEVLREVKTKWPGTKPVAIRFSCTDWMEHAEDSSASLDTAKSWTMDQTVELCKRLKREKLVDLIDCSTGGLVPDQRLPSPLTQGYQLFCSIRIRKALQSIPDHDHHPVHVIAVGLISEPEHAEEILEKGQADAVMMAREFLRCPTWVTTRAQCELQGPDGVRVDMLPQYRRARERTYHVLKSPPNK